MKSESRSNSLYSLSRVVLGLNVIDYPKWMKGGEEVQMIDSSTDCVVVITSSFFIILYFVSFGEETGT